MSDLSDSSKQDGIAIGRMAYGLKRELAPPLPCGAPHKLRHIQISRHGLRKLMSSAVHMSTKEPMSR